MKDYVYIIVITLLILFAGTIYLSEKSGKMSQMTENTSLRLKLDSLVNAKAKVDTIYQNDTAYIIRYKIKRAVDSVFSWDTLHICDYLRTYTDTMRSDEVDIWWDVQTEGELALMNWGYKLHAPLIIERPGEIKYVTVPEKKKYHYYATYDAGLVDGACLLGIHVTTRENLGLGYKYDFANKNHLIGISYKIR